MENNSQIEQIAENVMIGFKLCLITNISCCIPLNFTETTNVPYHLIQVFNIRTDNWKSINIIIS
jgi:hypothetical protein